MSVVPWWGKIAAKLVLSRLPFEYGVWQRLGLFRHGAMDTSAYAVRVFEKHVEFAGLQGKLAGTTILELGPGDGLATAMLGAAHGARTILIDIGDYVGKNLRSYASLASDLHARGLACPDVGSCRNIDELLALCNAQYLTQGLQSLRELPDRCVDLMFSQAVLEHISKHDFAETMRHCRRVLKPGGAFTNRVDLKDHLGSALNNLRFSDRVWESAFFAQSGFYTNRIRYSEMLAMFREAGFTIEWSRPASWKQLPTARESMAPAFSSLPEEELSVSGFDVLLR